LKEQAHEALAAGLLQAAAGGQIEPIVKALDLMQKEDVVIEDVIKELAEFLSQPPPQQAGPGGGAGAVQQAESLARGGIPGNAEQGPPGLGLPPLGDIMQQDARLVS